ncbi:MAG: CgeB family protein [Alcaligenes sp.]
MNPANVQKALDAFLRADYSAAIKIYRELGTLLGEQYFKANIEICHARLGQSEAGASSVVDVVVENVNSKEGIAKKKKKENPASLDWRGHMELSRKDPVWYVLSVKEGAELRVEVSADYYETDEKNRKAVFLLKGFDKKGNEVDESFGKMAKSSHLQARFKYLPATFGKRQQVHTFIVPDGVVEMHLGLCGFNLQKNEKVFVDSVKVKEKRAKGKQEDFVPPSELAAEISILGWPEYPDNGKPYVLGVMDEFTAGCFEQDLNLIQPRPDNWYALLEKYKPELIFIESAWKGNYGSWQYRVAEYSNKPGQEVAQLCSYAREKGIPTVFWNKEDPVHHDKFMCSAKLVDGIFTTDANMKESYFRKTGNPNIHALPFAAQPALHRPAPLNGRKQKLCFAGSWYGNRHAERGQSMRWLLETANQYDLDIYDRNHGTGVFPFPDEFQKGIKGSLPYKALCEEYNRYRAFLNVNSVVDSPTMFSRRVFELMACGTPIVSTYAKGIENLFESDAVWLVRNREEAQEAIHTLMTNDAEWRRRSLAGIREVFAKHTYAHRLNTIFTHLNAATRLPTDPPVMLFAKANNSEAMGALVKFAKEQEYRQFVLGIECSPSAATNFSDIDESIVVLSPGGHASWAQEQGAAYPIMGWIGSGHWYGPHYLRDLANASLYEPGLAGWAKAIGQDRFSAGGEADLCSVLWRSKEFLAVYINAQPDGSVNRDDLYFVDSDQLVLNGAASQAMVGV